MYSSEYDPRHHLEKRLRESLDAKRQDADAANAVEVPKDENRFVGLTRRLFEILPDVAEAARTRTPTPVPKCAIYHAAVPRRAPVSHAWLMYGESKRTGVIPGKSHPNAWGSKMDVDTMSWSEPDTPLYKWTLIGLKDAGELIRVAKHDAQGRVSLEATRLTDCVESIYIPEHFTQEGHYDTLFNAVTDFCIRHELEEPLLELGLA